MDEDARRRLEELEDSDIGRDPRFRGALGGLTFAVIIWIVVAIIVGAVWHTVEAVADVVETLTSSEGTGP